MTPIPTLPGRTLARRGSAVLALFAASISLPAQTFQTIHSFCAEQSCPDGSTPNAGVIQAANGSFYGTTFFGGSAGVGSVYKITPSGALTTVYNFCTLTGCHDGSTPYAGLVQDANGDFYGTTFDGGRYGNGTVFKITANGTLTTLYSFCVDQASCPDATDGSNPFGLVQATDGNFYGLTEGTVFRITPRGSLTTIYSFCALEGCPDGSQTQGALIQASDGLLYGITAGGGANGSGTVFKITTDGKLTTLHSFCAQSLCEDGSSPKAGLVQATNGDFYGTASRNGVNNGGTIFKITSTGILTTLYSFCNIDRCGSYPIGPLVQATNGELYGTTYFGGTDAGGTIFKITLDGEFSTLYSFQGIVVEGGPVAGLIQSTDGNLYGTTQLGGAYGYGSVFALSDHLSQFVETLPSFGAPGAAVGILGSHLEGATSVSFNGMSASFKVVSSSEIATSVPLGATTGTVQVVTPSTTLLSNAPFRVH